MASQKDRAAAVVVIAGPTASGKSGLAVDLAEALDGTVINADSLQVYRELSILTARPGPELLQRVPHRLFGVLPAADPCSAARWRDLAETEIAAALEAGRRPILVGGTGLYLRVLMDGLAEVPAIPAEVRVDAARQHAALGGEGMRAALAEVDPEIAARLPAGDTQRLLRAWEVWRATGRPLSAWQREAAGSPSPRRFVVILLLPPRRSLYAACDGRFAAMVAAGAMTEVQALAALGLAEELPAMKALGVPELGRVLRGEVELRAAVAAAQQSTRRYAKRQVTWFRHQLAARCRGRLDRPCLTWHGNYGSANEQEDEGIWPKAMLFILQHG